MDNSLLVQLNLEIIYFFNTVFRNFNDIIQTFGVTIDVVEGELHPSPEADDFELVDEEDYGFEAKILKVY